VSVYLSSLPLKAVETDFAVDSSGFGTSGFVTWYNARYGHEQDNRDWLKAHLMIGVKTNVVTSVEISGRHAPDALRASEPLGTPYPSPTPQRPSQKLLAALREPLAQGYVLEQRREGDPYA